MRCLRLWKQAFAGSSGNARLGTIAGWAKDEDLAARISDLIGPILI